MKYVLALGFLLAAAAAGRALVVEPAGKDLRLFYRENCARCHGADGTARDGSGRKLKGQDFTDAAWRESTADAKLVKTILKGKFFGLAMPAFRKELTAEEAQRFVTEIIRLAVKGSIIDSYKSPAVKQP